MKTTLSVFLGLLSLSTFAATDATLNLKGTVSSVSEISIVADASAQSINIVTGETALKVATVTEICNHIAGYDINMSSTNSGFLKNTIEPAMSTAYSVNYNGVDVGQPSTIPLTIKTVNSLTGLTTVTSDVKLSVNAKPAATAGDYTDTITFSIVAK